MVLSLQRLYSRAQMIRELAVRVKVFLEVDAPYAAASAEDDLGAGAVARPEGPLDDILQVETDELPTLLDNQRQLDLVLHREHSAAVVGHDDASAPRLRVSHSQVDEEELVHTLQLKREVAHGGVDEESNLRVGKHNDVCGRHQLRVAELRHIPKVGAVQIVQRASLKSAIKGCFGH